MEKDEKKKKNQAVIDLKKKTALKENKRHGQMDAIIEKAHGILEKLVLWRTMVVDEDFLKTLQQLKESTESEMINRLGIAMLEAFIAKDFESTQNFYEQIIKIQLELNKPKNDLLGQLSKTVTSLIMGMKTWQSFSVLLSSTLSMIIKETLLRSQTSTLNESMSESESDQEIDSYQMASSDIGWLFAWTPLVGQHVLPLTVDARAVSFRKFKCKYHMESYVEILFTGSKIEMAKLTYSDVRKKLKGKIEYEFVFAESIVVRNESTEINYLQDDIDLALFLPLVSSGGDFSFALQHLLKNENELNHDRFKIKMRTGTANYVSAKSFGEDIIDNQIAKMIIANNKDINIHDYDEIFIGSVKIIMSRFYRFPPSVGRYYCYVPYEFDPKEYRPLTSIDILSQLTDTDVSARYNDQDIVIITGLHQSSMIKDLLGNSWSHGQSTYDLSYIDDSIAVYEKSSKVNND